jgi:hypothetical protein
MALVDLDLYRPVLSTLNAIYEDVSPGGIVVVDDCQQDGQWVVPTRPSWSSHKQRA